MGKDEGWLEHGLVLTCGPQGAWAQAGTRAGPAGREYANSSLDMKTRWGLVWTPAAFLSSSHSCLITPAPRRKTEPVCQQGVSEGYHPAGEADPFGGGGRAWLDWIFTLVISDGLIRAGCSGFFETVSSQGPTHRDLIDQ